MSYWLRRLYPHCRTLLQFNGRFHLSEPGEPVFVLRGSDPVAAGLVKKRAISLFVDAVEQRGSTDQLQPEEWDKYTEALDCADEMEPWRKGKHIPAQVFLA